MKNSHQLILTFVIALIGGALATLAVLAISNQSESNTTELEARLHELENQLKLESSARERMAQSIDNSDDTQRLASPTLVNNLNLDAVEQNEVTDSEALSQFDNPDRVTTATSLTEMRKQILVTGGFTEEEANWVNQQQAEIELDNLYRQYRWRRQARENSPESARQWRGQGFTNHELRKRLGDEIYERYLKANGATTAAHVRSIVDKSPAAAAGLQAGDKITAYNGQRVFNMREVSNLTLEGQEGEPILLDIEREGNTIQLSIPRGPLGVTGN